MLAVFLGFVVGFMWGYDSAALRETREGVGLIGQELRALPRVSTRVVHIRSIVPTAPEPSTDRAEELRQLRMQAELAEITKDCGHSNCADFGSSNIVYC